MTFYRHYKNKPYRWIGEAKHSETLEDLVVYECLYDNPTAKLWVRPKKMFFENVLVEGQSVPRFAKVSELSDKQGSVKAKAVLGRCYCGQVEFELTFPTEFCSHCHCESCRRTHGSAFVTWTGLPKNQFRFIAGEEKIRKYSSRPEVRWGFCLDCGTSLLYDCDSAPEKIYVTLASLTGPLDREPDSHVSFEEHVNWVHTNDGLPRYRAKTNERI